MLRSNEVHECSTSAACSVSAILSASESVCGSWRRWCRDLELSCGLLFIMPAVCVALSRSVGVILCCFLFLRLCLGCCKLICGDCGEQKYTGSASERWRAACASSLGIKNSLMLPLLLQSRGKAASSLQTCSQLEKLHS